MQFVLPSLKIFSIIWKLLFLISYYKKAALPFGKTEVNKLCQYGILSCDFHFCINCIYFSLPLLFQAVFHQNLFLEKKYYLKGLPAA